VPPSRWSRGGRLSTVTESSDPTAELPPHLHEAYEVLSSGAAQILPVDGLAERLVRADRENRPLRVKLGIDPSGSQLTLGHAVVLRKLRQFQDFGHIAVLVVGGFTGQVGDPSGRTATRVAQTAQDVIDNAKSYFDQVMMVLDRERTEVVNNADWLGSMQVAEMLDYTRMVTVAQLLERDDFARRFEAKQPISLSEFFYPLLQGIDSVAIRADVELGGTDQTFNNLVGRELQRAKGQTPQIVLTVPLLVGTDGVEKMGKSLGNFIGLQEPAAEQFGKLMSVPDGVVGMYARLCTALHPADVDALEADVAAGGGVANRAKRRMAREVVALYHGMTAAEEAEARFDAVFKRGEIAEDAPVRELTAGDPVHLPAALLEAGLAASTSAARRDIDAGAVRIAGEVVLPRTYDVPRAEIEGRIVANGKRRTARLITSS
jgi:tyrosyl-tRNA synthetase